jgi:hypothetical protein
MEADETLEDEVTKSEERVMSTLRRHEQITFPHASDPLLTDITLRSFLCYKRLSECFAFRLHNLRDKELVTNILNEFYRHHYPDLLSEFELDDVRVHSDEPVIRIIYDIMRKNPPQQSSYILK